MYIGEKERFDQVEVSCDLLLLLGLGLVLVFITMYHLFQYLFFNFFRLT